MNDRIEKLLESHNKFLDRYSLSYKEKMMIEEQSENKSLIRTNTDLYKSGIVSIQDSIFNIEIAKEYIEMDTAKGEAHVLEKMGFVSASAISLRHGLNCFYAITNYDKAIESKERVYAKLNTLINSIKGMDSGNGFALQARAIFGVNTDSVMLKITEGKKLAGAFIQDSK